MSYIATHELEGDVDGAGAEEAGGDVDADRIIDDDGIDNDDEEEEDDDDDDDEDGNDDGGKMERLILLVAGVAAVTGAAGTDGGGCLGGAGMTLPLLEVLMIWLGLGKRGLR